MAVERKSDYLLSLESVGTDVAERYNEKIKLINNVDPYALDEHEFSTNIDAYPVVTAFDIVTYLVLTHSFYTKEQMKAYKSVAGYKYYEAGFVQRCAATKINEFVLVAGTVKHSQRMTKPSLKVWIICEAEGGINTAHCTCMAGASEVCSHVAAVLYAVEFINSQKRSTSCTDVKAQWMVPSITDVPVVKLNEMEWNRKAKTSGKDVSPTTIKAIEGEELVGFLKELESAGECAALMRVVEPFASALQCEHNQILQSVYNIYNQTYELLSYDELCSVALQVNQTMTAVQCKEILEATIQQSGSREWFNQRAGRITASRFKGVCRTSILKPSISLIKSVCYPLKFIFKSKATAWGLAHEKNAVEDYCNEQTEKHINFSVSSCGLCIDPLMPAFGASPDRLISCDCCGNGCVEVKCPYLLKKLEFGEYLDLPTSCLTYDGENVILKRNHAYYYQVQLQLKVSGAKYCDFVIWSPKGFYAKRILFDEDFWASEYPKAREFHNKIVLPELLGRHFTKGRYMVETWCTCNTADDGRPMLQCDNDSCELQWFHLECVGLADVPETSWLCEDCRVN